jgi:heme/copper-type cytochrome/quinol oxidase subunit 4
VAEVFAGFVIGYAMSLIFSILAALMVVDARSRIPYLAKAIAPNISAVALAVPISLLAFFLWTALGMFFGLLYRLTLEEASDGGLGSPNLVYTVLVLIFTAFSLTMVLALWRRLPWPVLTIGLTFAALFGWALPFLAEAAE